MRRAVVALLVLLTLPLLVSANEKRQGYCQQPATGARVLACTVTVYVNGTSSPAPIYSDNLNAPKSNPFTADATTGLWSFYADNGHYDIAFSGGSPSITSPYTLSDFLFLDFIDGNNIFTGVNVFNNNAIFTNAGITSAGPNTLNGTTTISVLSGTIAGNPVFSGNPSAATNFALGMNLTCPPGDSLSITLCADATSNQLTYNIRGSTKVRIPIRTILSSNYTNSTTSFTPVGQLLNYDNGSTGTYTASCKLFVQGSTSTAAPQFMVTGGAGTPNFVIVSLSGFTSASAYANATASAYSTPVTLGNLGNANVTFEQNVYAAFSNSNILGSGALQAAALGAGTLTILAGSWCDFQ